MSTTGIYDFCDPDNICVYVVMFAEYEFCIITFVSKSLAGSYASNCIESMINYP